MQCEIARNKTLGIILTGINIALNFKLFSQLLLEDQINELFIDRPSVSAYIG